ncbi:hypothetical protein [Taibaiella soli]|uniref:Uncharacterized protein n=1 Tax=Taibaiella soli TaxID=1649169 RepID=A0A2W2AG39_9BACT|nr:hypothetical protein [Taibaiella soli]PZF71200.1 hypothetical protein DN068_19700 [Taibaiella soli]
MTTELTAAEFKEILEDETLINQDDLKMFRAFFTLDKHKGSTKTIVEMTGLRQINNRPYLIAKRIEKKRGVEFEYLIGNDDGKNMYWSLFFIGQKESNGFTWQLKPNLITALKSQL